MKSVLLLPVLGAFAAPALASTVLFDWSLKFNNTFYCCGDTLPSYVDASQFDFSTGLGSITVRHTAAVAETPRIGLFLDIEIDERLNTFFNEYGIVTGVAPSGLAWEIDEPGYAFGDIYTNFNNGRLDQFNGVPASAPDDVSFALLWRVPLLAGESATVRFTLATSPPTGPPRFTLAQVDPDSNVSVYFTSDVRISPIPEPAGFGITGIGCAMLWLAARRGALK